MPLIRDDRDQFGRLVGAAAEALGLDPSLIEKDYWAVEALRAVHAGFSVEVDHDEVHIQPIFKGGTSLSKAHGLIQRFSEDVGLLVPVPADDPTSYSQTQRASLLSATTEAVSAALAIEGQRKAGRRGVDRHWLYPYEPIGSRPELVGVEPSIRVEVTVMGGPTPRTDQKVTALVADHAATLEGFPTYDDLTPVVIETLAPERTLVEKLAMVHDAANQALAGQPARLQGAGRHYYDIAMLLRSEALVARLSPVWIAEAAADADRWSAMGKYPFTPRPDAGFAASPAFTEASLSDVVGASYRTALTWVWGERPSGASCRSRPCGRTAGYDEPTSKRSEREPSVSPVINGEASGWRMRWRGASSLTRRRACRQAATVWKRCDRRRVDRQGGGSTNGSDCSTGRFLT